MIRKRKVFLGIVVLLIVMTTGTVYSYLSDQTERKNNMNIGENTVIVEEPFEPSDLIPGSSFIKSPSLKNTGVVNCYVRMLVECSTSEMEETLQIDWNTMDWTPKQKDGYYYYKKVLSPGETSVPIFTKVSVKEEVSDSDLKDFEIIVYGESIQVGAASNYEQAWEQIRDGNEENLESTV
ncbi:hypothetical protein NDGK_02891 [Clostridiales bacterium CHKCI001]|nr:hypothetical protein NDGK_02891 [Clostridiales bacterium CHKCI001]